MMVGETIVAAPKAGVSEAWQILAGTAVLVEHAFLLMPSLATGTSTASLRLSGLRYWDRTIT